MDVCGAASTLRPAAQMVRRTLESASGCRKKKPKTCFLTTGVVEWEFWRVEHLRGVQSVSAGSGPQQPKLQC